MRTIVRVALLAGIPLVIMTGIGLALLAQGQESNGRSTLAVGVIVAAVSASSVIYQIDRWTLRRQTAVHFAVMVVTVLPALFFSGWFALDSVGGVLAVIGTFLATGAILWALFYAIARVVERRSGRTTAAAEVDG